MQSKVTRILVYCIGVLSLTAGFMYGNYRLASASPGGVDFMTHWVGTRALLRGQSPYSDTVALEVQQRFYGRPAQPGENEFLDPYLLYTELIFLPFALMPDYAVARAAWMTFLEFATLVTLLVSLAVTEWKPGFRTAAAYILCGVLGYFSVRPIVNGSLATVIALLLTLAVWAIRVERDEIAGILMALALGKFNLSILPALVMLWWTFNRKRWRFIGWFVGSFIALVLGGMLIIPDWPLQNLATLLRYQGYNPPTTIGAVLAAWFPAFGRWIGVAIYALLAFLLFREWSKASQADFHAFLWMFSFTLAASQWFLISTGPDNFIILSLPLAYVLRSMAESPKGSVWVQVALWTLLIGTWALFLGTVDRSQGNLQSPIMFFPLPAFLMLALYFKRRSPSAKANPAFVS